MATMAAHFIAGNHVFISDSMFAGISSKNIGGDYTIRTIRQLAEYLVIAELLDLECATIKVPRSGNSRHTIFTSSLRRARIPLQNLITQARHGTTNIASPEEYAYRVKLAIFKFKRALDALQRMIPRGHVPGFSELVTSAYTIARRLRNPFHNRATWIAERAKWLAYV
jgi:hypothetical protein